MHLRVFAFGGLVVHGRQREPLSIAHSCRPLIGYLLTHRKCTVSREEVAETLWPGSDGDHARRNLSTVLWRLHKSVQGAEPIIAVRPEHLSLDWRTASWVDAIVLERRIAPLVRKDPGALTAVDLARLERGVRLYRGDYLVGIDQEWSLIERQRLRNLYLDGLYSLSMAASARRDWPKAIECGWRLAAEEPLREDVHRLLMQAYAAAGNRAKALDQYRICAEALSCELDIEPMSETRTLFRELSGLTSIKSTSAPAKRTAKIDQAQIERALRLLRQCEKQLQTALDAVRADEPDRRDER